MTTPPLRASADAVRRLVVEKQHLTGRRPARASPERILEVVRALPYVQWDPVSVVAPSHLLSLWARIGPFRTADLDRLLWTERRLLQHWIPFAAIVSVDDYPLYASLMRRYPDSLSDSWGAQRAAARAFLRRHRELRRAVVADLRSGPKRVDQFADHARTKRRGSDWAPSSAVAELLWHLLMSGEAMVVGHEGNQNLWGWPGAHLPPEVDRRPLSAPAADRAAAERSLRGLGVATPREIHRYFVRGCYRDIRATLDRLEAAGRVRRVVVDGLARKEVQYVHADDADRLIELESGGPSPRVAILPPFDNMVYDIGRGRRLFGFDYVREQFLPKERRRYGMWVLPVVRGERFLGRLDARLDKGRRRLEILAAFAEPAAAADRSAASDLREELDRLAAFVGADSVGFGSRAPSAWKTALR